MTGLDFHSTLQLIKDAPRPVTLVFVIPNGSSDRSSEQAAEALPSDVLEPEYRAEQQVVASTVPPNATPAQLPTRIVADKESDSARALEVLKQARQRLSDAHQYQMKMALQAATEAAERQVQEATQAANARFEQLTMQSRQAHVKHVQARVAEAQQITAQRHEAAAKIQSQYRQHVHRQSLSRVMQQVRVQRDLTRHELESSAQVHRRTFIAETEESQVQQTRQHASEVRTLTSAKAECQRQLSQTIAQLDDAKLQHATAEAMYHEQLSKADEASRQAAELEQTLARKQREFDAKLQGTLDTHREEKLSLSRANQEQLNVRDAQGVAAQADLARRHVAAAKIQAGLRQYQHRNVTKALVRAHAAQKQVHGETTQALMSTVAANADAQAKHATATMEAVQEQLSSLVLERDRLAQDALDEQTMTCEHHHAAATIQRRYHELCYCRAMKRLVAAHAEQRRSALSDSGNDAAQADQLRTELEAAQITARGLHRQLTDAQDSQRRADAQRRTTGSKLRGALRVVHGLQRELTDTRNAVVLHQTGVDEQLRLHASYVARATEGAREEYAGLTAALADERRKANSLQETQTTAELVQLQKAHASQMRSCKSDLQECQAALEASRLAERQAKEEHARERNALAMLSDADARSREVWGAKVRAAQELVREAELRVKAVEHQTLAKQDEVVRQAVAAALREASDTAASEFSVQMAEAAARSKKDQLDAAQKLDEALKRAVSSEEELDASKRRLEQAEQALAVIEQQATKSPVGEQKTKTTKDADTQVTIQREASSRASEQMEWSAEQSIDAKTGGSAWEEVMRENTESKVSQMRAEAEAARLRRQLQFTTGLLEELEMETSQKDEQIAVLQNKVNTLRRRSRSPHDNTTSEQLFGPPAAVQMIPSQEELHAVSERPRAYDNAALSAYGGSTSTAGGHGGSPEQQQIGARSTTTLMHDTGAHVGSTASIPGVAPRLWRPVAVAAPRAPSRKMTELESSVGDLVLRLQSLSNVSIDGRRADQRSLDELRGRLRSSGMASGHSAT